MAEWRGMAKRTCPVWKLYGSVGVQVWFLPTQESVGNQVGNSEPRIRTSREPCASYMLRAGKKRMQSFGKHLEYAGTATDLDHVAIAAVRWSYYGQRLGTKG